MFSKLKYKDSQLELVYFISIYIFASIFWFFILDLVAKIFITSADTLLTISAIKGTIFLVASIYYLYIILKRFDKKEKSLLSIIEENEKFYRRIFDLAPIGMMMLDREGNIVDANSEICKLTGYRFEELIRMNVIELAPLQDEKKVKKNLELLMEGYVLNHEVKTLKKDNSLAYFNLLETRIQLPKKASGILVIAQDMTEKRKLIEKLKNNEKLLDSFFDNSSTGFYIMLLDEPVMWNKHLDNEKNLKYVFEHERIVKFNSALTKLYGINSDELLGMNHTDLFENIFEHSEEYWQNLYDDGELRLVMRITNDMDEFKWIEGEYVCLYDEVGRIKGHIGIQHDITEHIEERDKYLELLKSFEDDKKNGYKLLNDSFGELNGKIDLIKYEMTQIEDALKGKKVNVEDEIEKIQNVKKLSEMTLKNISCLSNYTELNMESEKPVFSIVNLSEVMKNLNKIYEKKADEKNIKYVFQNGISNSIVDGEKQTIVRLLSLLIESAIKNSESGEMFVKMNRDEKLKLEIDYEPLNPISKDYSVDVQSDKVLTAIVNEYCNRNCIDLSISKGNRTKISLTFNNTIKA